MGVTLKQIAELAGTTKSTVDKVIHDRPGVSDEKRRKIKELLQEYGYEANPLAKALNYQKRKLKVAIVLPGITAAPSIRKGMDVVRQDFLSFNIQVEYHDVGASDAEAQVRCLQELTEEGVSGVIVLPIRAAIVRDAVRELVDKGIPVVVVNSRVSPDQLMEGVLCYVGQDMLQSGRVAARMLQLISGGRAKIGIISCHNMVGHEQREQSFRDSICRDYAGFEILDTKYILETPEDAYRQAMSLLEGHPDTDALFITCGCVSDICRAVRDYRAARPDARQPIILCYEKYPKIRELIKSGEVACTLTGGLSKQGRFSMRVLFEYLVYDRRPDRKAYYFNNKIMIRENC